MNGIKKNHLSPLAKTMHMAASQIHVQSQRMLVVSQNIAHVGMRTNPNDPGLYKRQIVSFKAEYNRAMEANLMKVEDIKLDKTPPKKLFDPGNPAADEKGFVAETNVSQMIEMNDLRESSRAHEAGVNILKMTLDNYNAMISLLKP
jgi:flagellar basal-body rod protein FlgC